MKKTLLLLFSFFLSFWGSAQVIGCGSPLASTGLPLTFCGQVKGSTRDSLGKRSGTILFLCGNYPYQWMTIVIKDEEPAIFAYTPEEWIGKQICVTGVIGTLKGKYYMEVRKKKQLIID